MRKHYYTIKTQGFPRGECYYYAPQKQEGLADLFPILEVIFGGRIPPCIALIIVTMQY